MAFHVERRHEIDAVKQVNAGQRARGFSALSVGTVSTASAFGRADERWNGTRRCRWLRLRRAGRAYAADGRCRGTVVVLHAGQHHRARVVHCTGTRNQPGHEQRAGHPVQSPSCDPPGRGPRGGPVGSRLPGARGVVSVPRRPFPARSLGTVLGARGEHGDGGGGIPRARGARRDAAVRRLCDDSRG